MRTLFSMKSPSRILVALALPFFAGVSLQASAGDIPQDDHNAPCGVLKQLGEQKYIYNNSNFLFNAVFKTNSIKVNKVSRTVNAGAVKYLDFDENGQGIWRDNGVGDYHKTKSYTVPVANNSKVRIAYCADSSMLEPQIEGVVSFEKAESDGEHNGPQGNVYFRGVSRPLSGNHVAFDSTGFVPFVDYNKNPTGSAEDGSLTICPRDLFCTLE